MAPDISTTIHDDLCGGTDFSLLSWLEHQWVAWYIAIGSFTIATGLMSFLLDEVIYFGRSIPWIIMDAIPYQGCTRLVLSSHFTVKLPVVPESIRTSTYHVLLPFMRSMLPEIAFFFFFEDLVHYIAHQMLRIAVLYNHIHHKYCTHVGLAAEYAHSAEVMIRGAGTLILLYCYFARDLHIFSMYVWMTLRLFQVIEAHSGYDFPWSLQHILPVWSGAEHHDFHHMAFANHLATSFRWWDRICGTDTKYQEHRVRVAAPKETMNNAIKEQQDAMEQELMAEVGAEGVRAEAEADRNASKMVEVQ
ncbi:C4-methyl sterol oxidase [Lyophyllum atratum]|nr:C4-methyl sterol oxidase [Lyophyllum atratum]